MAKHVTFYFDESDPPRPDDFDYDVIIVGSGIAGLSAAYSILVKKRCGLTVLIIESDDKVGGRLGMSGATKGFFIDSRQTHINRLISELGLPAVYRRRDENESRVYWSRNGPVIHQKSMFDQVDGFIERLDYTAERIEFESYANYPQARKLARMSLDALIRNFISSPEAQEFMTAIACTICGVETTSVSALWFILMSIGPGGLKRRMKFALGNNRRKFIQDGAENIVEKLWKAVNAEHVKIQTGSVVDLIEFNNVSACVSVGNDQRYKCEYVIVAVPPPANSKIRIFPPNERILRNQMSYEPGKGTFFLARYDEAWWQMNNYSGDILGAPDNSSSLRLVYEATLPEGYLAGFFFAKRKKSSGHPLDVFQNCWAQTRWGETPQECKSYAEWEWPGKVEGTTIRTGGYPMSVMRPCNVKDHLNPMLQPNKRVYWACSEYARSWPGTLDGAVESGEYAANSILYQLRPQSLNSQELRSVTPNTAIGKNDLPPTLVVLHFVIMGITTAVLIIYCKPVQSA